MKIANFDKSLGDLAGSSTSLVASTLVGVYSTALGGGRVVIYDIGSPGADATVDLANGSYQFLTLTANLTTLTLAGATDGTACTVILRVTQDGTGGWVITWPGNVTFVSGITPYLSPTAGSISTFELVSLDGATTWRARKIVDNSWISGEIVIPVNNPATGVYVDVELPFIGLFTGWTVLNDTSGSIVFDVWRDTYANYPPTVADKITASDKPTTTATAKAQGSCTGWTTSFSTGDILRLNIDSTSGLNRSVLSLKYRRVT